MDNSADLGDPLAAPLWRKFLAVRILALSVISVVLAGWLIDHLDTLKLDLPRWLDIALVLPAVAAVLTLVGNLAPVITDLAIHFVPPGRLRQWLLLGVPEPAQTASDFEEQGYFGALLPFFFVVGLFAAAAVIVIALGGVTLLVSALAAVSGWPSWAVVITILLALLLLKK